MARNPLRMPKGVPPEIVRALRLGQKKPGQYLDYGTAFVLRDALQAYYTPTPKKRRPPVKRTKPAPKPLPPVAPPPQPEPDEEPEEEPGALEWECGIDYHAAVRTSNVAFNARFFRADGRRMVEEEARDVLRHIIYTGEAPVGVVVQEVFWQRRKGGHKRYGRTSEMTAFYDILSAVGDDGMTTTPLRLGAVKPNRL